MKLPGGLASTRQPSYPLRSLRPDTHPAMALGEASHAGSACALGSEGPCPTCLLHNFRRSHSTVFTPADRWSGSEPTSQPVLCRCLVALPGFPRIHLLTFYCAEGVVVENFLFYTFRSTLGRSLCNLTCSQCAERVSLALLSQSRSFANSKTYAETNRRPLRRRRLPTIVIEETTRNMRCAQGRGMEPSEWCLKRQLGERSGYGAHSPRAGR
jgi:hypothetical protein